MINSELSNNRRLELYEVLDLLSKKSSRKDKISVLQEHQTPSLTDYLQCVFDDRVVFNLPTGAPPYEPAKEESYPSSWQRENRQLAYLVKGLKGDSLMQVRRENIFIGVLESVHPRDAEILVDMINKRPHKGLTKKLAQEAYPNLIPN